MTANNTKNGRKFFCWRGSSGGRVNHVIETILGVILVQFYEIYSLFQTLSFWSSLTHQVASLALVAQIVAYNSYQQLIQNIQIFTTKSKKGRMQFFLLLLFSIINIQLSKCCKNKLLRNYRSTGLALVEHGEKAQKWRFIRSAGQFWKRR